VSGRVLSFALDAAPVDLHERLRALPGVQEVAGRGDRVSIRTADSDRALRAVLADYPAVRDIAVVPRTMDDAFLALTADTATTDLEEALR
ncbi:ABC transporter ATP-binding protein, partial [Mesorhizobium japonicum]